MNAIAVALMFLSAVLPVDDKADQVLDMLESASDQLKSFRAEFEQVEIDEFRDETRISGTWQFLRGGRMRLSVINRNGQVLEESVTDGKTGWQINHNLKKVDVASVSSVGGRISGYSSINVQNLKNSYTSTYLGEVELRSGPAHHLRCKPIRGAEGADPTVLSIEIWVNVEFPSPIVKIKATQRGRVVTTIELYDIQRNVDVDPGIFKYRVPRGYEEIKH